MKLTPEKLSFLKSSVVTVVAAVIDVAAETCMCNKKT